MDRRTNDRRSVLMIVSSMLIFGTIGVFRKYIPVSSAFLACSRGILGGLCILLFSGAHELIFGKSIPFSDIGEMGSRGAQTGPGFLLVETDLRPVLEIGLTV